ncbi:hypothetical protein F511_14103 [Dorcoceras hygrometricum]|uniref:Uncharacterized protein n=1 Tax=Dorcoceras hygrometricum TaxID=472368 RepID=A0A2Z7B031_9LAMI|nr:hypothetical protein F511_14103 [Dorcoceras hygrometricum]
MSDHRLIPNHNILDQIAAAQIPKAQIISQQLTSDHSNPDQIIVAQIRPHQFKSEYDGTYQIAKAQISSAEFSSIKPDQIQCPDHRDRFATETNFFKSSVVYRGVIRICRCANGDIRASGLDRSYMNFIKIAMKPRIFEKKFWRSAAVSPSRDAVCLPRRHRTLVMQHIFARCGTHHGVERATVAPATRTVRPRKKSHAYANKLQKGDVSQSLQDPRKLPKAEPKEASQQEESSATTLTSVRAVYRRQSEKIICLLVSCDCWLSTQRASAEYLARRRFIHCYVCCCQLLVQHCSSAVNSFLNSDSQQIRQHFLFASTPACATAELSSSAEHDFVTDYIIIDGPLGCSSWFPFDVPAGSSSSSNACSWFLSFQLIHYVPAGSTWPPPDYEQLTQLWTLFNSCSLSCCIFFVTTLRATAVSLSTRYFAPGCHASLLLLFLRLDTMSTGYAIALKLATGSTVARDCFLFASTPACGTAELSSSAEHDVVTDYIIIDGPLGCSSWFPFDVPAGSSSSSNACSWFLSFQLIHYVPAGSTWPPPDYEQLTQLWTSPLLIQLPSK